MRKGAVASIALGAVLAVSPLLAQEGSPTGTSAQAPAQTGQADPNPVASSQSAGATSVTGTIVSISGSSLELKAEPATGGSEMGGQTLSFAVGAATEMPAGLRVGDRVSVWFGETNGSRSATRVALVGAVDSSSTGSGETATGSGSQSTNQGAGQGSTSTSAPSESQATSATGTSSQSSTLQAQPSASATTKSKRLPHTASPLPLIGLVGLVALAMAVAVRFVVRSL